MGQVEAVMATLKNAVHHHRRSIWQYLDTHITFTELGEAHRHDFINPHRVTKDQVGLSNILNYPIVDASTVMDRSATDFYLDLESAVAYVQTRMNQSATFVTPGAVSPVNGVTLLTARPRLEATPYTNVYGIPRQHREFRITDADTGKTLFYSSDNDYLAIMTYLADATTYTWSARDVAQDGSVSKWSIPESFQVPSLLVNTPQITLLGADDQATNISPAFVTTPFEAGSSDAVHARTRWSIYQGTLATPVWELVSSVTNLVSVSVPSRVLMPNTAYRIEAVHEGKDRGPSDAGMLAFFTRPVTVTVPYATVQGQVTATSIWPVFDVSARFSVTGDTDEMDRLQANLYQGSRLVWADVFTQEPLRITPTLELAYGQSYQLELRYYSKYYGASEPYTLAFDTTTGGSRGYLADEPQSPTGVGYSAVTLDNQWLETRGKYMRSHFHGETLWALTVTNATVHGVSWAHALNAYLVMATHSDDNRQMFVGCLTTEGEWSDVLVGVDLPPDTGVSSMVYHGLIDGIYHFSADTTVGVCYFTHDPVGVVNQSYLVTPPANTTMSSRFLSVLNNTWVGGWSLQTPMGPRVGLFKLNKSESAVALIAKSFEATAAIQSWGYAVTQRDTVGEYLIVDRGDQSVRLNSSLNIIEIRNVSRYLGGVSDVALLDIDTTSLTRRSLDGIGYNGVGPVRLVNGKADAVKVLTAASGDCVVQSGTIGVTDIRLRMASPEGRPIYVNGFNYDYLTDAIIPDLAGYEWVEHTLHATDDAPYEFDYHTGFQVTPVSLLDTEALLSELTSMTEESGAWEALFSFYQ